MSDPRGDAATNLIRSFATLITPSQSENSSSRSAVALSSGVDRALGAIATIGIGAFIVRVVVMAVRRAMDNSNKSGKPQIRGFVYPSIYVVFTQFFRSKKDQVADDESIINEEDGEMRLHLGSCHCRSIHFELGAPSSPQAYDCNGKIRYPHLRTTEQNFMLTKGTEHLKTYYVRLPSLSHDRKDGPGVTAAHAFCTVCGVHILRAPDSRTNSLEINSDCLDTVRSHIQVLKYNGKRNGLGAGKPLFMDDRNRHDDLVTDAGEEKRDRTSTQLFGEELPLFKGVGNSRTMSKGNVGINKNMPQHSAMGPGTPATTATSGSDSLSGSTAPTNGQFSLSDEDSAENSFGFDPLHSSANADPGVDSWSIASSFQQVSRHTPATPSPGRISSASSPAFSSPILRDQLKHYMKRHIPSPSPS